MEAEPKTLEQCVIFRPVWFLGFPREEFRYLKILGVAMGLSWLQRVYRSVNTANVTAFIHLSYEPLVNWGSTLDSIRFQYICPKV